MEKKRSDPFADLSRGGLDGLGPHGLGIGSAAPRAFDSLKTETRVQDEWRRLAGAYRPDTATAHLERGFAALDPVQRSLDKAHSTSGLASDEILRRAGLDGALGPDLASVTGSIASGRAIAEATRESFIDKTAREIVEANNRASELALGRGLADRTVSAIQQAERDAAGVYGPRRLISGLAVADALRDTYALLGTSASRDRVLGYVTGVGSLAPIAAGIADAGGRVVQRTQAMLLETQQRLLHGEHLGTIGGALRAGYGDLFPAMRSPRASEIEAVLTASREFETLKPYSDWAVDARARFEAMATPWVREDLPDASIAAMARMSQLDRLVAEPAPAAPHVVEGLRARLGDYREAPDPAQESLDDPVARTSYQLERGLDPVLTVLPTAVLATMFAPLGLNLWGAESDPDQLENAVRMMLKRLEQALRRFIAAKLREFHGEGWFETLPSDIRGAWKRGRQRAIDAGRRPDELIAYADIDHYRKIIEHPDNWGRLFEPVFGDLGAIRETLRRIRVIRNAGAHFHVVTPEDLIVLRAEGVHLANWLGIRLGD